MKKVNLKDLARFSTERYQKIDLLGSPYMFFDLYCFEPGQEQQGHAHKDSDKIYYVLEGTARVEVDDESETLNPGAAAMAPAGSHHSIKNPSASRLVVLVAMAPRPTSKT